MLAFEKEFAKRADKGNILGEIKRKLHREIISVCSENAMSP